jgi:prephenate dehydratase
MKICIIGGRGKFGQFLTNIFLAQKHSVQILGRSNLNDFSKYVKNNQVIILSVPLEASAEYYNKLAKIVNSKQLIVDISSVMSVNLALIKKIKAETVFIHPLFAPNINNLSATKYILAPVNTAKKTKILDKFLHIIEESGGTIHRTSVAEHERIMSYMQALFHFSSILLAKSLADSNIEPRDIDNFATTFFRLEFDAISRIFSQKAGIYADIQFNNSSFKETLNNFRKILVSLEEIVANKDYEAYDKVFSGVIQKLSPLIKNSFEESQSFVKILPTNNKKLGYLGPMGSYSELAAEYLGKDMVLAEIDSIGGVIRAVNENCIDVATLPIENSIQGSIAETVDGLYQNKLFIKQAVVIPINHCAVTLIEISDPKSIDLVLSHPQALGQCARYIANTFPNAKVVPTLSTAHAFKKIAEEKLLNTVAIGNQNAAHKYNLNIFAKSVEDESNNETKFVLVSKTFELNSKGSVTSLVIVPKRDRPGLLFNILKYFKDNDINLNKIESRPSKQKLGTYVFHVDILGNYVDSNVKKAIAGIEVESEVIFLGSYNISKYDKKS